MKKLLFVILMVIALFMIKPTQSYSAVCFYYFGELQCIDAPESSPSFCRWIMIAGYWRLICTDPIFTEDNSGWQQLPSGLWIFTYTGGSTTWYFIGGRWFVING